MIVRLILWILIILCVAFFVIFNVEPKVTLHLFPGFTIQNIPLALVIIISFVLGLLAGVIFSLGQVIKYKMKLRRLSKELKEASKETPPELPSEEEKTQEEK